MPALRTAVALLFLLSLFAVNVNAADEFAGYWTGQLTGREPCSAGGTGSFNLTLSMVISQAGSDVNGRGSIMVLAGPVQGCAGSTEFSVMGISFSGTASGNTLTVPLLVGEEAGTMTLTRTADSLSVAASLTTSGTTITGTVSRAVGALTGTYIGTYNAAFAPCGNPPLITFGGKAMMTVFQNGNKVSGTVTIFDDKKDRVEDNGATCRLVDAGTTSVDFAGDVQGSTLALTLFDEKQVQFTATVSGNTISGTVGGTLPGEGTSFSVTRTLDTEPAPVISRFVATPSSIPPGGSTTLSWTTTNATGVTIDNGVGAQPPNGSVTVTPPRTTTYTLTATGAGGSVTASLLVAVAGSGPRVVVAAFPRGMLLATGDPNATDSFTVANIGSDSGSINLTQSGNFFTVSPTSFTLEPGGRQVITVTGTSQPAGVYSGSVTVAGQGVLPAGITVPVRLLVAAPPSGSVRVAPNAARVDVSAPAGQSPSGFVRFTNSGSSQTTGIAVADVPWIIPQSDAITIAPGETKNVTFSIDPSRRDDGDAPAGGATGSLSLRVLGGSTSANAVAAATTTTTITVSIVHVATPPTSAGAPPPLQPGEIALLVGSHASAPGIQSDLYVSNRSSSAVSNVQLFLTQASRFATLTQLGSNRTLSLPSVSTSVFGVSSAASLVLRGSTDVLSTGAVRMVNPTGARAYSTSVPVFTSNGGVTPGGTIVLSGVERSSSISTTVVIQELSGNPASVTLQAYDENGAAAGAPVALTLGAFASLDDTLSVTDAARSLVVTNTGSGSSRVNAYARLRSATTGDSWIVTDPSLGGSVATMVMPTIGGSGATDLYVTNRSATAATATVNAVKEGARRRAARSNATEPAAGSDALQQWTLQPRETRRLSVPPSSGYLQLTGTPGAISASARATITASGNVFGSALPTVGTQSALRSGNLKRFGGVYDASAATVAAGTSATFRTSLILIETAGSSATVRVTVSFSAPAGLALSTQASASREFTFSPGQSRTIADLARTVIGSQRDSFGDLRDMQVDVQVVGGGGAVLAFIQSTDNGSGDVMIRPE